jgi:hypothetical protein
MYCLLGFCRYMVRYVSGVFYQVCITLRNLDTREYRFWRCGRISFLNFTNNRCVVWEVIVALVFPPGLSTTEMVLVISEVIN